MQKIALFFALFLFSGLYAQSTEHYLLYDAVCMQKFDYERNEDYKDPAFCDYHLKLNEKKTIIFRVFKKEDNIEEVAALDREPLRCRDEKMADERFLNELSSSKYSLSIAEYDRLKKNYKLSTVKSIMILNTDSSGFSLLGETKIFFGNKNKVGDNIDSSGGKIIYMGTVKIQCFNLHQFRAYDKVQSGLYEELYFADNIGLLKISREKAILDLANINGIDINEYMKGRCKNSPVQDVQVKKDSFVLDSAGYYVVKSGDNLYRLANHFNTRVDIIMALNNMKTAELKLGQKIKIKDDGTFKDLNPIIKKDAAGKETMKIHIVRQGENLQDIATKYKVSVQELMILNNMKDSKIAIFQELIIEKVKP